MFQLCTHTTTLQKVFFFFRNSKSNDANISLQTFPFPCVYLSLVFVLVVGFFGGPGSSLACVCVHFHPRWPVCTGPRGEGVW